jgi:hypothetical protein
MRLLGIALFSLFVVGCANHDESSIESKVKYAAPEPRKLTGTSAPRVFSVFAKSVDVLLLAEPIVPGSITPLTLASRSFTFEQELEHRISLSVERGNVMLQTQIGKGVLLQLPEGFVAEEKEGRDGGFQLGTFVENGAEMCLLVKIREG